MVQIVLLPDLVANVLRKRGLICKRGTQIGPFDMKLLYKPCFYGHPVFDSRAACRNHASEPRDYRNRCTYQGKQNIALESTQNYPSETSTWSPDYSPESKGAYAVILDTACYKGFETHPLVRRTSSRSISLDEEELLNISAQVIAFLQLHTSATLSPKRKYFSIPIYRET
jgi:hypothetical protein